MVEEHVTFPIMCRWAGILIQLQNLSQNHISDLSESRELVRLGDYESLEMLYDDIPDTLF